MENTSYYKCSDCSYEFLSRGKNATCPHCKSTKLEMKDIKSLASLND